jgi:hypothetical protein
MLSPAPKTYWPRSGQAFARKQKIPLLILKDRNTDHHGALEASELLA